jgi:hypothetical protein
MRKGWKLSAPETLPDREKASSAVIGTRHRPPMKETALIPGRPFCSAWWKAFPACYGLGWKGREALLALCGVGMLTVSNFIASASGGVCLSQEPLHDRIAVRPKVAAFVSAAPIIPRCSGAFRQRNWRVAPPSLCKFSALFGKASDP